VSFEREPDTVTVVEDEELGPSRRPTRVGTAALLEAIRALPDAVAERLEGHTGGNEDGEHAPEVTFVGDPPPVEADPLDAGSGGGRPSPAPDPAVHRAEFKHPSRRKHRSEAIV